MQILNEPEYLENYVFEKDSYRISTKKSELDFEVIHNFLSNSYWSPQIPMDFVKKAAKHSITFGIYDVSNHQVGYARVISDQCTYAYLADVFVLESERGKGLSKWLMECIMSLDEFKYVRNFSLQTLDAHTLYHQFGFQSPNYPDRILQIIKPDIYKNLKRDV